MQDTAGEARTSSSVMYSYGPPHMTEKKQDDQLEHTYIQQLYGDTGCSPEDQPKTMNDGEKWERGSEISMLAARHHDDDDITSERMRIII